MLQFELPRNAAVRAIGCSRTLSEKYYLGKKTAKIMRKRPQQATEGRYVEIPSRYDPQVLIYFDGPIFTGAVLIEETL